MFFFDIESVSLCSHGLPGTHSSLTGSASGMQELKVCTDMPMKMPVSSVLYKGYMVPVTCCILYLHILC